MIKKLFVFMERYPPAPFNGGILSSFCPVVLDVGDIFRISNNNNENSHKSWMNHNGPVPLITHRK